MSKFLLVTDLDHTLVGDDTALENLNQRLSQHRQEYGTKIVYATGRSPVLYRELQAEKQLIEPDALVLSVGTEIYLDVTDTPEKVWVEKLSQGWDRDAILATTAHFADLVLQSESEQRPFKVSFYLSDAIALEVLPQLKSLLEKQNLEIKLIYSGGRDLDILPRHADKGLAMQFLSQQWGMKPEQTVVCGDSGNDISLFSVGEERGIIVGNAQSELLQWHKEHPTDYHYLAKASCAGGIMEGLNYFGFLE